MSSSSSPVVFFGWVVHPVVWKNGFGTFPVNGIPITVFTTFLVLGNKVVEANFLHVVWSFGIEIVHGILLENVGRIWVYLPNLDQFGMIPLL